MYNTNIIRKIKLSELITVVFSEEESAIINKLKLIIFESLLRSQSSFPETVFYSTVDHNVKATYYPNINTLKINTESYYEENAFILMKYLGVLKYFFCKKFKIQIDMIEIGGFVIKVIKYL